MTFDLFDTINGPGVACSTDMLMATIDTQKMRDRVAAVRQAVQAGKKDEAARLKKRLPAVTWQAHFPDGKRRSEGALSSGLYMLDIDGVVEVEKTIDAIIEAATEQCILDEIVAVHISPSGKGIRVVAICSDPARDTIEKNQAWLAEKLGILSYDEACKDFARLAFLVAYEDFKYLNLDLLTKEAPVRLNNNLFSLPPTPSQGGGEGGENDNAVLKANTSTPSVGGGKGRLFSDEQLNFCFHGMRVSEIAEKYLDYFGRPQEGERNNYYYNMCINFRHITDYSPGILLAQLPDFGLTMTERQKVVESATKKSRGGRIPYAFWKLLEELGLVQSYRATESMQTPEDIEKRIEAMEAKHEEFPQMPLIFREYCRSVPPEFRWPMTAALLPILGTIGTRIRGAYLDGRMHSPTFHSVIIAPASSGKSLFNDVYFTLTEELSKRDDVEWEKEKLYKMELQQKKNAKTLPERPHTRLRLLNPSISVPMLLHRQEDVGDLHQLTFTPEIDTLAKTNRGRAGMDKNDMYRQAWDNDVYGQDYMMTETFSGKVRLYQNFLLTGTPQQAENFYGDPENGLISRVMFAHIDDQTYASLPAFRRLTKGEKESVDRALKRLYATCYKTQENGKETIQPIVDYSQALTFMHKPLMEWLERTRISAMTEANLAKDNFRKRAAVKAFRAALVAVAIYGKLNRAQQTMVKNWALWIADMDLKEHVDMYLDKFTEPESHKADTVKNLFRGLDENFAVNDVTVAMKRVGRKSQPTNLICAWKKAGLIIKTGKGLYVKTEKGKSV